MTRQYSKGDRVVVMAGALTGRQVEVNDTGICPVLGVPEIGFIIDWPKEGTIGYALPEAHVRPAPKQSYPQDSPQDSTRQSLINQPPKQQVTD